MYVWVGSQAHENEILHAIKRGKVNGEIHSKLKIDLQWCKFLWICLKIFPCNPSFFLKTFCQHKQYPEVIPICRIADDSEPNDFKKNFYDWREKDTKHRQLTKLYSIGNIGTRCMLYDLLEKIWFYYIIFTDEVCMIDMKLFIWNISWNPCKTVLIDARVDVKVLKPQGLLFSNM